MIVDLFVKIFAMAAITAMASMMLVLFMIIFSMGCAGFDIITGAEACYNWCCY